MNIFGRWQKQAAERRIQRAQEDFEREQQKRTVAVLARHQENLRLAHGLRHDIMMLHRPVWSNRPQAQYLSCRECWNDGGGKAFPCETYKLARDWDPS